MLCIFLQLIKISGLSSPGCFLCQTQTSTEDETNLQPNIADTAGNVIFNVLKRNKQFKSKLIVADLTGSMYPYAQQISTWLKLQFLKDSTSQHFVFFNDGDKKKDIDK